MQSGSQGGERREKEAKVREKGRNFGEKIHLWAQELRTFVLIKNRVKLAPEEETHPKDDMFSGERDVGLRIVNNFIFLYLAMTFSI